MKTHKPSPPPVFFDVELRVQWLLAKGNPLSRLEAVIDWESFRPLLEAALDKPAQGPGGPRPNDLLKMFKALLVQRFYNLSDEPTEYQINDRLSFQQFIDWTLADKVIDANTLCDFREALVAAGAFEKLFARFDEQLRARDLLVQPGKRWTPVLWTCSASATAARKTLRSRAARCRRRGPNSRPSSGKRIGTRAGRRRTPKCIMATRTTSKRMPRANPSRSTPLPMPASTTRNCWHPWSRRPMARYMPIAPTAVRKRKKCWRGQPVASQIHELAYRNRPQTDAQKETNRQKSKIGCGSNTSLAT